MRCAVVLAGGRSSRMGTDKLALTLEGETLLGRAVRAAAAWAERVVVASPERSDPALAGVTVVLEDPPLGGPAAGLAAAVAALPEGAVETLVLAGDLADPWAVVAALADADLGDDGVVLVDDEGWPQYLAGRYRVAALRRVVEAAPTVRDVAVRRLLAPLQLRQLPAAAHVTRDIDTPEQARAARVE